ncbi:MAG: NAD(P)H-hydrate dehydratase, partial [Pyrinomonadaceae bacterium]
LNRTISDEYESVDRYYKKEFRKKRRNRLHISLDIPSGLSSDTTEIIGKHMFADITISFTSPKVGNVMPPASGFNGELIIANIGSPQGLIDEQPSQLYLAEEIDTTKWLAKSGFSDDSYKNKRGHCLVIAGSESFSGAAVLVGDAAMRSGAGLVTVVTPRSSKDSIAVRVLPEVMVRGVAETDNGAIAEEAFEEIKDLREKADAVAIGSGLSQSESTRRFVRKVVEERKTPVVIDADALNLLSPWATDSAAGESRAFRSPMILTPHEGEFMRLLGTDDKETIKDRVAAVREFSQRHGVILVLKGERVLIGEPGGKVVVNPTGNSGLGKAGNGDTLTGIVAGFVTQAAAMQIDIFETVVAAVYVAGMAGDVAEKKYGKRVMTASDVRECLVEVFEDLSK